MNLNPTLTSWKLKFSPMSWHFSIIYAPDDVIANYCHPTFAKTCLSNSTKVWRHKKLNLWNYGICQDILKEQRPSRLLAKN